MPVFLRSILMCISCLFLAANLFGQGGKAEPKRIEFAKGGVKTVLTGILTNSQEMEYVFAAGKGQTVTIRMNTSLFDYRVFNEEADFETEFESSPVSTFEIPESGDYMLFVRKKMVRRPRTARFALTLSIK